MIGRCTNFPQLSFSDLHLDPNKDAQVLSIDENHGLDHTQPGLLMKRGREVTENRIRGGIFQNLEQPSMAMRESIDCHNRSPMPSTGPRQSTTS